MDPRPRPGNRAYRALLRLLPRAFRNRWGSDMEEVFSLRLRRAGRSPARVCWVWVRGLADLLLHSTAERLNAAGGWRSGAGRGMVWWDMRQGIRSLGKAPLLSLAAVFTLALGIGAATATFSVVHAVLLRDLPYADPDGLVMVWPEVNANKAMAILAEEEVESLVGVSGISRWSLTLTGVGEPREIYGTQVSIRHFDLLGVRPALGRAFRAGEDLPGAAGVVILSHALWAGAFGADPDVVGRSVDLSGAEYDRRMVIGVMPPGFRPVVEETDAWIPLEGDPALPIEEDDSWYVNHRLGRLAPGASLVRATEEIRAHARRIRARIPSIFEEEEAATATVQPLRSYVAGRMGPVLWVALGAVSLVLLIACANVANLLLARGEARAHALAVHVALGAGRRRLARMLFAESLLLGVFGGGLGIALAHSLVGLMARQAPADFPRISEVGVSGPVLGFALAATLGATLLAGLVPAFRSSRVHGVSALGGAVRGTGRRASSRLSAALVGLQVALAVVVAVGAGLMIRSLAVLLAEDTGMDGTQVLAFHPSPPGGRYPHVEAFRAYYDQVMARVGAVPGVTSVGAIQLLPGTDSNWSFPTFPEGAEVAEGSVTPTANFRAVRPGYFRTLRIPLLAGRMLDRGDNGAGEPVVVVNRAFADRFWSGGEALGKTVQIFNRAWPAHRVVGVVGNVRQHRRSQEPLPEMYFPHDQAAWDQMSMWILARVSSGSPLDYVGEVRAAVWDVDRDVPISEMEDMRAVLGRSTHTTRFLALLLSAFGVLALALGAVGVFGVTAYTVGRRVPEFGVRLALGSPRRGILASALARSSVPVALGMLGGLGMAALASGFLRSALYGVSSSDPITFLSVVGTLGLVAILAMVFPVLKATAVDPARVLNSD